MAPKIFALLLCVALPLPVLAQPHAIAELGTAPLIGQVSSTRQLQGDVASQRAVFAAAGEGLGLTPAEFARFEQRIANKDLTYVAIPRRLDAMSWRSGGQIHVLRDVVIPAHTMGWEVDLVERGSVLALFIPNKCGNLSMLRRPLPVLAQARPVVKPAHVAYAAPAPVVTQAPAPPASPAPASPSPTPAPYVALAGTTGPAHHFRLWPLIFLPIFAFLGSHGGHGGITVPPISSVGGPTPPPPVVGCTPTPKP